MLNENVASDPDSLKKENSLLLCVGIVSGRVLTGGKKWGEEEWGENWCQKSRRRRRNIARSPSDSVGLTLKTHHHRCQCIFLCSAHKTVWRKKGGKGRFASILNRLQP